MAIDSTFTGLYVISEGQIEGPSESGSASLAKSVYLNGVPIADKNGNLHTKGVSLAYRSGTPTQTYISGITGASASVTVGVEVSVTNGPQTITIPAGFDAANITLRWPNGLYRISDSGERKVREIYYYIDLQNNGSSTWVQVVKHEGAPEKHTSAFEHTHRIELPSGAGPWTIRVTKGRESVDDEANTNLVTNMYLQRYETITDGKFSYPNIALLGVQLDAAKYGDNIPSVQGKFKGIKVWVPKNYDPVARTYATTGTGTSGGTWDGTFKLAYTNNPVWLYFDMVTNNRYGLGLELNPNNDVVTALADKWNLYVISQYCDEMIADGYGGTEPRFTYNAHITSKSDAYEFLQNLVSSFRGMIYYASDQLYVAADIPDTVSAVFTQTDVEDGVFNYVGSPLKTRSSVVTVRWRNPKALYREEVEWIEDFDAILEFGYRVRDLRGDGITSRGLARRLAKWLLLTEKYQTQTVQFRTDLRGAKLFPGKLIKIMDPYKAGVRNGGKVLDSSVAGSVTTINLDSSVTISGVDTYSITLVMPDMTLATYTVSNAAGTTNAITIAEALPTLPQDYSTWILTSTSLDGQLYRVVGVKEVGKATYEVTGVYHYASKYSEIEQGPEFDVAPTSVYTTDQIPAPTSLDVTQWYHSPSGGATKPRITVSWAQSSDNRVEKYELQLRTGTQPYATMYKDKGHTWDSGDLTVDATDDCYVRVRAISTFGVESMWTESAVFHVVAKDTAPNPPDNFSTTTAVNATILTWDNPTDPDFKHVEVYEGDTNVLGSATLIAEISDDFYLRDLAAGTSKYYWLRTISHALTNNASSFVGPQTGSARAITYPDFDETTIQPVGFVNTLPSPTGYTGPSIVFNLADNKLYKYEGGAWTDAITSQQSTVATGIQTGSSLPGTAAQGDLFFLTTDNKLYRYTGSAWTTAVPTTDLTGTISNAQIASNAVDIAKLASGLTAVEIVASLPATGNYAGRTVYLTTDQKLYRYNGTSFTSVVAAADVSGTLGTGNIPNLDASKITSGTFIAARIASGAIDATKLASSISAVEIFGTLPTTGNFAGRTVFLTTDSKLYRYNGTSFVASVPTTDLTGTISNAQIAANAVDASKIAAGAIDATKLASTISAVEIVASLPVTGNYEGRMVYLTTDDKLYRYTGSAFTAAIATADLTGTITTTQITDNAITTAKIAANAVTASQIAANTITASQIAANTITAGQIAAGAITATEIAAGAILTNRFVVGDYSNMVPDANMAELVTAADNVNKWYGPTATQATIASLSLSASSTYALTLPANTDATSIQSPIFSVEPGKEYWLSGYMIPKAGSNVTATLGLLWYDSATGNTISASYLPDIVGSTKYSAFTDIPNISVTRASGGYARDSLGNLTWFSNDTARITDLGLLIESSITNLVGNSQDLSSGTYTPRTTNLTVSTDVTTAPDGTTTADLVTENTTNSDHAIGIGFSPSSSTVYITVSVFVKANGRTKVRLSPIGGTAYWNGDATFDLSAETATLNAGLSCNIEKYVNGWYRCCVTAQATGTSATSCYLRLLSGSSTSYAGDGVSGVYAWGWQREEQEFASSYIPTTSGTVTRQADVISQSSTGFSSWWNASEGTVLTEVISYRYNDIGAGTTSSPFRCTVGFGTGLTNQIVIGGNDQTTRIYRGIAYERDSTNNLSIEAGQNTYVPGTITRHAVGIKSTNFGLAINGILAGTSAVDTSALNITKVTFGANYGGGAQLNGYLRKFVYIPRRVSDNDLTTISTRTPAPEAGTFYLDFMTGEYRLFNATANTLNQQRYTGRVTAPAGVSAARYIVVRGPGATARDITVAEPIVRKASIGEMIVDGAITTDKLAANAVTAAKIAAGTITANEIAANTITASQIAANTITAGQIAAGTIGATQIAANTITTNKLVIGDISNMVPDPDLSEVGTTTGWSTASGSFTQVTSASLGISVTSTYAMTVAANASDRISYGPLFAVEPGKDYLISCYYKFGAGTSGSARLGITTYSDDGVTIVGTYYFNSSITADGRTSGIITAIASTARRARFMLFRNGGGDKSVSFAEPIIRKANRGEVIVDGTLAATKLVANSITASQIAAGTITSTQIAADTITAGNIAANAITSSELAANSVIAGKISAGVITATEIAASAITASKLALTDRTNLVSDPTFTDMAYWTYTSGTAADTSTNITTQLGATSGIKFTASGANPQTNDTATSGSCLVEPNKSYRFTLKANQKVGFKGQIKVGVAWLSQSGSTISTANISGTDYRTTAVSGSDVISTLEGLLVAPSTAYKANFVITCDWPDAAASAGSAYVAIPRMNRAASAELIVDGTITGTKIAANTITASNITAATITATELATDSVTSNKILAGAVTAAKISVTSLSAISANIGTVTASTFLIDDGGTGTTPFAVNSGVVYANAAVIRYLNAGSVITVGTGGGIKVALQSFKMVATDGDNLTWPADLGNVPTYVQPIPTDKLTALSAGEKYNCYLENITSTGATVRLKKVSGGTTSAYSRGPGSNVSGRWELSKVDTPDSNNTYYNFRIQGTAGYRLVNPPKGGTISQISGIKIQTWFYNGTTWTEGDIIFIDVTYPSASPNVSYQVSFDKTVSVAWPDALGASGKFGISIPTGTTDPSDPSYPNSVFNGNDGNGTDENTITSFVSVGWNGITSPTTSTACPSGETTTITVVPQNV